MHLRTVAAVDSSAWRMVSQEPIMMKYGGRGEILQGVSLVDGYFELAKNECELS